MNSILDRVYLLQDIQNTKSGVVVVLRGTHETLRIAVDSAEAQILRGHLGQTIKLAMLPSKLPSEPPPSSSKIRG